MNTRDRILTYLQTHPQANAAVLSRALGLTVQDIRYHLGALRKDGRVVLADPEQTGNRGRPVHNYCLGARAIPAGHTELLHSLLAVFIEKTTSGEVQEWLPAVASHLAREPLLSTRSPSQRLNRAVKRMKELGYQVRWEARPKSPWLYIDYSPFAVICKDYPALTGMDRLLVEALTGYALHLVEDLPPAAQWHPARVYQIQLR